MGHDGWHVTHFTWSGHMCTWYNINYFLSVASIFCNLISVVKGPIEIAYIPWSNQLKKVFKSSPYMQAVHHNIQFPIKISINIKFHLRCPTSVNHKIQPWKTPICYEILYTLHCSQLVLAFIFLEVSHNFHYFVHFIVYKTEILTLKFPNLTIFNDIIFQNI